MIAHTLFTPELCTRLTLVLAHSLWQALVLAALLWLFLLRRDSRSPGVRHAAAWGALLGVLVAASATWAVLGAQQVPHRLPHALSAGTQLTLEPQIVTPAQSALSPATASQAASLPVPSVARAHVRPNVAFSPVASRVIVCCWLAGVFAMLLRLGSGLAQTRRLRLESSPVTDTRLADWARELAHALGIRRECHLAFSRSISSPAVFGFLANTVLIPPALATAIPPDHLRALLAHEFAHIARHDYLLNVVQSVCEALLFFNPAVWWIGRQLRNEREACCDRLAAHLAAPEPAVYAEALASAVACIRAAGPSASSPAFANAAADPRRPSWLADRIARLLSPGYRPALRLPWHSLILALVLSGLALCLFAAGTCVAVAAAARALTPRERMEHIDKVQQSFGVRLPAPDATTTISGTVRFEGLTPEEAAREMPGVSVETITVTPHCTSFNSGPQPQSDGHFVTNRQAGEILVTAKHGNWALAAAGPFDPATTLDVDLILTKGYESKVRVTDDNDKPLSGALVKLSRVFRSSSRVFKEKETNDEGIAVFQHMTSVPLALDASAPGCEPLAQQITCMPDTHSTGPVEVSLHATKPATGVVLDAATSKPLSGAELVLMGYSRDSHTNMGSNDAEPTAITSTDGKFSLGEMRAGWLYAYLVRRPPYQMAFLRNVQPGQSGLCVQMERPLPLSGRVIGPIRQLMRYDDKPYILAELSVAVSEHSTDWREIRVPVQVLSESSATFVVQGLPAGKLKLIYGRDRTTTEIDLHEPLDNVELHIGEKPPAVEVTTRTVKLRFITPLGSPPPGGVVNVRQSEEDKSEYRTVTYPLSGAELQFTVPVDTDVWCKPDGMTGYWFNSGKEVRVPAGQGPFEIKVFCVPAGAIYGHIVAPGRNLPSSVEILNPVKSPQVTGSIELEDTSLRVRPDGRFMVTPLPLGGSYIVVARCGPASAAVGETIELTEAHPTAQIQLTVPKGATLRGTVHGPDGAPIPSMGVSLLQRTCTEFSVDNALTDAQGHFVFDGVTSDPRGALTVSCDCSKDWQPREVDARTFEPIEITLQPGTKLEGVLVEEQTSRPLAGYRVGASSQATDSGGQNHYQSEAATDANGQFRFSNLPPNGRCFIDLSSSTGYRSFTPNEFVIGQTTPMRIVVKTWKKE